MKIVSDPENFLKKRSVSVMQVLENGKAFILEFRKGLEEKSSLSKEQRESSVGGRRRRRVNEDGLGAAGSI